MILPKKPVVRFTQATLVALVVVCTGYVVLHARAAGLVGDLNNDGVVNVFDMSSLLSDWGTNNATADLNSDGTVNIFDLSALLSHWGQTATTPSPTTSPTPTPTGGGTGTIWQPAQNTNWMWEIGTPLVLTNTKLMGTGVTAYNGDTAPGDDPAIYDIDGINNPESTVSALHAMGKKVVCYIEVGTAGDYYSAAEEGIATTYFKQLQAAGVFGTKLSGYPEYFLNINSPNTVSIIEAMIQKQCAGKGFDGVETDLDETFNNNEGNTGFTISQANEETYLTTLANYMHSVGLAWIAKNLDDTGIASFVSNMEPKAQGMVSEECNYNGTCSLLSPFLNNHKWIGDAEYTSPDSETTAKFCPYDNANNINGVLFDASASLGGGRAPCR